MKTNNDNKPFCEWLKNSKDPEILKKESLEKEKLEFEEKERLRKKKLRDEEEERIAKKKKDDDDDISFLACII